MSVVAPLWLAVFLGVVMAAVLWFSSRRGASAGRPAASLACSFFLWALLVDLRVGLEPASITLSTPGDRQTVPAARRVAWPDAVISPSQIAYRFPGTGTVDVTGDGLPPLAWLEAPDIDVVFDPRPDSTLPVARWPRRVQLGLPFTVEGQVPSQAQEVRLVFPSAGGLEVGSATPQDDGTFSVRATPPAPGRYLFRMEAVTADGAEYAEPVAVEVIEPIPIRVHFELSRPSFEARALKSWMTDSGVDGEFVVELAPEVKRREQLGDGLDGQVPDLWIGDAAALGAMDRTSMMQWQERLNDGMGALVLLDSTGSALPDSVDIRLFPPGAEKATTGADDLPVTPAARLDGGHPLATVSSGQVIITAAAVGRGKLGVSAALDTHTWKTRFGIEAFAAFWSPIIRHLARSRTPEVTLAHAEGVATAGFATRICILDGEVPAGFGDQPLVVASTMPDPDGCYSWWPSKSGWNYWPELGSVYVYDRRDWSGWRAALRVAATSRRAVLNPEGSIKSTPADRRFLWWLLLLVSILGLWFSERIPRAENRDMAK